MLETQEMSQLQDASNTLVAEFTKIWHHKMIDLNIANDNLYVQAVGFQMHRGQPLGILIAPWFMNLIQLPGVDDNWSDLSPGIKEIIEFPSGCYEFIHNRLEQFGDYKSCSLFSHMNCFIDQSQANSVADAVMQALFSKQYKTISASDNFISDENKHY